MKTFSRVLSIICLVAWMGLIFFLSSQDANESSAVSGGLIKTVVEKIYPDYENLTENAKQELVSSFQHIARKSAHFFIFAGLGLFAFLTFISYTNLKFKTRIFWVLLIGGVYAASDEIHQNFVSGRSMELRDFLIDFCGVIFSVLICILFVTLINPLYEKVRYKNLKAIKSPVSYNFKYEDYDYSLYIKEQNQQKEQERMSDDFIDIQSNETKTENEVPNQEPLLSEEFEYAASIIGKTVVEATKTCNELTAISDEGDTKELVNLVLGRTEVLKAEILKILKSDNDFEQKKDLMQKEQESAYDYFNSIKAQIS